MGENLQDHLQIRAVFKVKNTTTLNTQANSLLGKAKIGLEFALKRSGPMSMAPSQLGAFTRSDPAQPYPNLEYHVQPLSLDAFGHETFRVANAGGMAFRLAVSAVPFLLPLLFQDVWGRTPVQAGAMVLWVFVGNLAIKPATTPLLRLFGYRSVLIAASAVAAVTVVLMAFMATWTVSGMGVLYTCTNLVLGLRTPTLVAWLGAGCYAWYQTMYLIGLQLNLRHYPEPLPRWRRAFYYAAQVVLMPVFGALEGAGVLYALARPERGFFVIRKPALGGGRPAPLAGSPPQRIPAA